ncbi:MAG: type II secretion system protein GspJ [Ponticaulis sp.]|nr:type II secretion system protein GspJ [Ponticaulis sp.]
MNSERGFSLIEVLVALFVLSIVSAAGTTVILRSVSSKEAMDVAIGEASQFTAAHSRMRDDFAQWVPREAESRPGLDPQSSFVGGGVGDSTLLFSFVRDGWTNPGLKDKRSGLIAVRYIYDGGAIIRQVQTRADPAYNQEPIEQIIFSDVVEAYAEFSQDEQWVPQWRAVEGDRAGAPVAVRLTFELQSGERFVWMFLTPAGAML